MSNIPWMANPTIPTPAEYAGGLPVFEKLTARFYEMVAKDSILAPVFEQMGPDHPQHVAAFMVQCFGHGTPYSKDGSENTALRDMVGHHLGRHLTEEQRRRWVELL